MRLELVLAAGFGAFVIGLGTWSYFYSSIPRAALPPSLASSAPSISVPPAPLLSVYNASPKLDVEEEAAIKRRDAMFDRCHMGGGIPVMGYGWRVVCLKPSSADWWEDPKMPEYRSTLKP